MCTYITQLGEEEADVHEHSVTGDGISATIYSVSVEISSVLPSTLILCPYSTFVRIPTFHTPLPLLPPPSAPSPGR